MHVYMCIFRSSRKESVPLQQHGTSNEQQSIHTGKLTESVEGGTGSYTCRGRGEREAETGETGTIGTEKGIQVE